MADKDDTGPPPEIPYLLSPVAAAYRALAEVHLDCDQFDLAMRSQDAVCAESAALEAVSALLAATAALQRVDPARDSEERTIAELAASAAHRRIIERFARWGNGTDSWQLHSLLCRLRIGLALARGGEPPPAH